MASPLAASSSGRAPHASWRHPNPGSANVASPAVGSAPWLSCGNHLEWPLKNYGDYRHRNNEMGMVKGFNGRFSQHIIIIQNPCNSSGKSMATANLVLVTGICLSVHVHYPKKHMGKSIQWLRWHDLSAQKFWTISIHKLGVSLLKMTNLGWFWVPQTKTWCPTPEPGRARI